MITLVKKISTKLTLNLPSVVVISGAANENEMHDG